MPGEALGGYILAGGKSSRMGQNKAFLEWRGEPLVVAAARSLAGLVASITLVGDPLIYGGLGFPVIPDHYPGCGPLAGIHAALRHSPHEWALVTACDMLTPPHTWAGLLNPSRDTFDCVIPTTDGRLEPLGALYHRRGLPSIEAALSAGHYKVAGAIGGLRLLTVPFPVGAFRNLNTPEDWREFVSQHV